ncbi:MAG: MATE family efflux transporter [Treponema sp.]|nr:MATE family efflux transporter [Treponema sp.]
MKQRVKIESKDLMFSNRDLWTLIWPLLIEQSLQITLGIADIIMVSSLGESAVGGVSLVDQFNILLVNIFSALATGGAVVCSQYIGRSNMRMAEKTARQLIYAVTAVALIIMGICLLVRKPLLSLIFGSIEKDVMDASQKYFLITLLALPGIALYNAAAALFRAQGNSRISMIVAALVNVLNIGGNAWLIYGLHCGVEGVAIPTLISRLIAAIILLVLLYRQKSEGKAVSIRGIFHFEWDWHLVGRILKIGIPNCLENSMFQFGKILVLSLVATFGTAAIAANAAANTIAGFEVIPGAAVGMAMLTVIGQCMGAGKTEQASYYTKKMLFIAIASMWVLNIPLLLSARWLLVFYNMSPLTTDMAWWMMFLHGFFGMLIWSFSFSLPNALRASGDATFTMIVSILSMWIFRVGMSYLSARTRLFGIIDLMHWDECYGAVGTWLSMNVDWAVRSAFFIGRFISGKWKNATVI